MTRKIIRMPAIEAKTGMPQTTLRWYRHKKLGPTMFLLGGRLAAFEDDVDSWISEQAARQTGGAA